MEGKKNLCAMIPAELHAKIMAEKEQLELNTLAEYVERIFTEHFEGGQISSTYSASVFSSSCSFSAMIFAWRSVDIMAQRFFFPSIGSAPFLDFASKAY